MNLINFYEVMDRKGNIAWGGTSASEAIAWFRRGLDNAIFVSVWDESKGEDPILVTDKIEVSALLLSALASEREKELSRQQYRREWVMK